MDKTSAKNKAEGEKVTNIPKKNPLYFFQPVAYLCLQIYVNKRVIKASKTQLFFKEIKCSQSPIRFFILLALLCK
jgi:hypothetical protein